MANFKYSQQKRFIKNVTPDIEEELGGDSKIYYNHKIDLTLLNTHSYETYFTFIIVTSDSTPFTEETFKALFDNYWSCSKLFQCYMTQNGTLGNLRYLNFDGSFEFISTVDAGGHLTFSSLTDTVTPA